MSKDFAVSFVKEIKELGLEVPKLEISRLGALTFVSAFSNRPTEIMANSASAGVDFGPDTAITKALVEHYERSAFAEGIKNNDSACERLHSDGVASFPNILLNAKQKARQNAYFEAFERYVWARWWDDSNVGHSIISLEESKFWKNMKIRMTVEAFKDLVPLETLFVIEPHTDNSENCVLILMGKIKGKGYVSGGAAGAVTNKNEIITRGLSELIRHGLAVDRFTKKNKKPETFYEKRLLYFGSGQGNSLVESRMGHNSDSKIEIPELEIDQEIKSENFGSLIYTHRCLFKDQPPFVDGELERLCL